MGDDLSPDTVQESPSRGAPRSYVRALVLVGAWVLVSEILARGGRLHPELIELCYSRTLYPWIQGCQSLLGRWFGFSVTECTLILGACSLIVGVPWIVVRALRRRYLREFLRLGQACLLLGLSAYGLFLWLWGFNYSRPELAALLHLEEKTTTPGDLAELCQDLLQELEADLPALDSRQEWLDWRGGDGGTDMAAAWTRVACASRNWRAHRRWSAGSGCLRCSPSWAWRESTRPGLGRRT